MKICLVKECERLLEALVKEKKGLSYTFFLNCFKENYNLGFRCPVKMPLQKCGRLMPKKIALAEVIYKCHAKKCFSTMIDIKRICKNADKCCMASVALPSIPVQDVYYFRQFTVNKTYVLKKIQLSLTIGYI